jgi:tetratricopeptide (TPR) repeat protein
LWLWTTEQQEQHQAARISGDFLKKWFEQDQDIPTNPTTPNSLAEWSRSVNSDHFTQKRKEIHRQKRQGRPIQKQVPQKLSSKEYLQKLTKTLQTPSSPYSSNKKVKELYMASKQADQMGERNVAIQLLETLVKVAPNDGRIYRRLSRMYKEQGDIHQARAILQMGIRRQPKNPWLWHGAAQLEQPFRARKCYKKALQLDPTFAHSYHALGTLEHTEGNIAQAMKIFKKGIDFCPTNHRLHHALGDLYRGAKLLEDAERSYHRSLEHGSPINYCFAYSALASVAYERDNVGSARKWLQRSVRLNNGRHAQGWVSLAQLEEAQGNEEAARSVCMAAITQYECGLIESRERYRRKQLGLGSKASGGRHQQSSYPKDNPLDAKNLLLKAVPKYRSGDKFLNVYRNWARVEERYGSYETVDQVYERASIAFPLAYKLTLDWASYHATMYNHDRARSLYVEACNKASSR